MPELTWSSKSRPEPPSGGLEKISVIYPRGQGYPAETPRDRLIFGDNDAVMGALLPDLAGKIDLIYADPPFFTNRQYPARIGQDEDSRRPEAWQLDEGYTDDWPNIESYLDMLYPRLVLMHRLLSDHGSLYLHLDWHANHYARLLMDEIFGPERLLNEIIWVYHGPSPIRSAFNRKHDTILVYTKSDNYTFNVDDVREPYHPNTVKTFKSSPKAGFGKKPNLKRGKVPEDWWYFPVVARLHNERTGYPTQKPQALLERILRASSNPGDLVADFFCGSGTTLVTASRLGRRFIGSDVIWRAIYTTRSRLVENTERPFELLHSVDTPLPGTETAPFLAVVTDMHAVRLETDQLEQILYWEVCPDPVEAPSVTTAQSVRPRKKGTVQPALTVPGLKFDQDPLVRMILQDGTQHVIPIKK
jgi:DNA modification methylase